MRYAAPWGRVWVLPDVLLPACQQALAEIDKPMMYRTNDLGAMLRGALLVCSLTQLSGCASLIEKLQAGLSPDKAGSGRPPAELPPTTNQYPLEEGSDLVGYMAVVRARHEDTLMDIGRRFDVGYHELKDANPGVDGLLPGEGTEILIPKRFVLPSGARKGIVLNLAALRMFYFPPPREGERPVVITHPVGIGREGWRTPTITTKIAQKVPKPTWYPPESIRKEHAAEGDKLPAAVGPGPNNPLGEYAMRLGLPKYLIHGTNKPDGIGMRVSHGCIQMFPEDIENMFKQVPVGTPVRIINEPYVTGMYQGQLYLQAYRPLQEEANVWKGSDKPAMTRVQLAARASGMDENAVDWPRVTRAAKAGFGYPLSVNLGAEDENALRAQAPEYPPASIGAPPAPQTTAAPTPEEPPASPSPDPNAPKPRKVSQSN
jgi:L,D-transpeptidase ErfK/SrfK